jgi:toxin FitB
MYLFDTNVISALRRPHRELAAFGQWGARVRIDQAFLSAITILELEMGVLRIERRDQRQGRVLRTWIDGPVLGGFAARILPVDEAVVRCAAALHVPDPRPAYDALIAATAIVHGLTLVTRNVADFAPMGVALFDPWQAT